MNARHNTIATSPQAPERHQPKLYHDLLTPEEVQSVFWFVEVCERKGTMSQLEADEWRRRIVARKRFLELAGGETDDE